MSRRASIILLLSSLNDHLPPLGTALKPTTGMAANARKPCPDCGHTDHPGWLVDGFKRRRPCLSCGGRLEPRPKRGRGMVSYDPMDVLERPIQTSEQAAPPTRAPRMVACDACAGSGDGRPHLDDDGRMWREVCGYCGGHGKRVVASFDLQLERASGERADRLTEAVAARTDAGSYHELDQALAILPPPWRKVVYDVHVNRLLGEDELCETERYRLTAAMHALDLTMPERIVVPGAVRANARLRREHLRQVRGRVDGKALEKRDKEIRVLLRQGKPRQWVAAEFGISISQTYVIAPAHRDVA